jgi:hypothetical protein
MGLEEGEIKSDSGVLTGVGIDGEEEIGTCEESWIVVLGTVGEMGTNVDSKVVGVGRGSHKGERDW